MENTQRVCKELKTDRTDIEDPLPGWARIIPVLFVVSLLAGIGLNASFIVSQKKSETAKEEAVARESRENQAKKQLLMKIKDMDARVAKAETVVKWVEGSRPVQPLAIAIARSMSNKATIAELSLRRDPANPGQIRMLLKFDGGGNTQLEETLAAISDQGYRYYQTTQTKGKKGGLDYQATLIWQGTNDEEERSTLSYNNQNE